MIRLTEGRSSRSYGCPFEVEARANARRAERTTCLFSNGRVGDEIVGCLLVPFSASTHRCGSPMLKGEDPLQPAAPVAASHSLRSARLVRVGGDDLFASVAIFLTLTGFVRWWRKKWM
jgi:hypothetical protein